MEDVKKRYSTLRKMVIDEKTVIAEARSITAAKRIANTLNIYRPKRRSSREQERSR